MWGCISFRKRSFLYTAADNQSVEVAWDELDEVSVSSRWMGSFDQRFVWHIVSRKWQQWLDIPFEAEGTAEFREQLAKQPGFVSEVLDDFLASSDEGQMLYWRR